MQSGSGWKETLRSSILVGSKVNRAPYIDLASTTKMQTGG
jgi:hypothetical protein